jgi:hypothetical protein
MPIVRRHQRLPAAAAEGILVDLALVLAIDVSGSVSQDRLLLQRRGYTGAMRHPHFVQAVRSGPHGRIALTFVEWSEARRQRQVVDWQIVHDAASAETFAAAIEAAAQSGPGWTSISAAIDYAVRLLAGSGFTANRRVIDISGDGVNNDGREVTAARDDAVAAGVVVNGLPILEVEPALDDYFRRNVIGGPGAFMMVARTRDDFATAVLRKLLVEIAGRKAGPTPAIGV